jgi:hypothetical protein
MWKFETASDDWKVQCYEFADSNEPSSVSSLLLAGESPPVVPRSATLHASVADVSHLRIPNTKVDVQYDNGLWYCGKVTPHAMGTFIEVEFVDGTGKKKCDPRVRVRLSRHDPQLHVGSV